MFVVAIGRECFAKAGAKRKAGVQGLTRQAQTHRALYHATTKVGVIALGLLLCALRNGASHTVLIAGRDSQELCDNAHTCAPTG